jgi:hypothetical protein
VITAVLVLLGCEDVGDTPRADVLSPYAHSPSSAETPEGNTPYSATPISEAGSVLSENSEIPLGETGELVPSVWSLYSLTGEQQLIVDTAVYALVDACMAKQGFTFLDPMPTLETSYTGTSSISFDGYIGLLNDQYASVFGYKLDPSLLSVETTGMPGSAVDPPSIEYEAAMKGVHNPPGCVDYANAEVYADLPDTSESTRVIGEIYREARRRAEADPVYLEAAADWSACMAVSGFKYSTPAEVNEAFEAFSVTDEAIEGVVPDPTEEELATARRDVACKAETRIADVWRQLFWDAQLELELQHRPTLAVARDEQMTLLANAERILAELER